MNTRCCGFNECNQLYKQHEHTLCEPCYWNETRKGMANKQKKKYSQRTNIFSKKSNCL